MAMFLVIFLLLAIGIHAESFAGSSSHLSSEAITSSFLFDVDEELEKIAASCLSTRNYEQITGNVVRGNIARQLCLFLIDESVFAIALTELRETLKFGPVRPWRPANFTAPCEGELASAPTIEAYYNLKEPHSKMRSLDSEYLFQHNLTPAIAYWDKRFPSIRTIFRLKFEKVRRSNPVLNRKAIDRVLEELRAIKERVHDAMREMRWNDEDCWERLD